jgi:salicylate hydroxylase
MQIKVAVIGCGIGGLAAGLSLLQAGFDVHIYEQANALREVGAGIQIGPNASRVIYTLGLGDELGKLGVRPLAFHQRRWENGRTLLRSPLGDAMIQTFGFPFYQLHRADAQKMLINALPPERLHLGHRLTHFVDRDGGVEVRFENDSQVEVGALIGADGIHSTVRRLLFGPENPRFTGCIAYRGLIPAEWLKHLNLEIVAQVWMGPGKHVVVYYVAAERLVNFVGLIEQDTWTAESWTERGDVEQLRAHFDGWDPQLRAIVDYVKETFIWGLFDRAPLPRWSVGRVTLLGDACHPMLPFMAQGAAQAIEDGASLTRCLAKDSDIEKALQRYQQLRLPRTARIQAMSSINKTRFHMPDGPVQQERDAKMAAGGTDFSLKAISWIYGYDASAAVETGDLGLPAG